MRASSWVKPGIVFDILKINLSWNDFPFPIFLNLAFKFYPSPLCGSFNCCGFMKNFLFFFSFWELYKKLNSKRSVATHLSEAWLLLLLSTAFSSTSVPQVPVCSKHILNFIRCLYQNLGNFSNGKNTWQLISHINNTGRPFLFLISVHWK